MGGSLGRDFLGTAPGGYLQSNFLWEHRWQEGVSSVQRRLALMQAPQDFFLGGGLPLSTAESDTGMVHVAPISDFWC